MKTKIAFMGALVTVCLIGWAVAGQGKQGARRAKGLSDDETPRPMLRGGPPPSPVMAVLDADKNGELSAAEIANASAALLTLDADADGVLSAKELRPTPPEAPKEGEKPEPGDHIMRLDADEDGYVTFEEFTAPFTTKMKEVFASIDTSKDEKIDKDEAAAAPPPPPPGRPHGMGPGGPHGPGGRGGCRLGPPPPPPDDAE